MDLLICKLNSYASTPSTDDQHVMQCKAPEFFFFKEIYPDKTAKMPEKLL